MKDKENKLEWHDYFIEALYARYPKRPQLVEALMQLLVIEREAVYRRLRKDVMFSINEIEKISSAWGISLDEMTGSHSGKITFQMQPLDYLNPSAEEIKFLQHIIQSISEQKDYPDTEFMDICNKVPRQLHSGYKYLNLFYLFKWMYNYGNEIKTVPFSNIVLSEAKNKITNDYYKAIKNVPNSSFIFDRLLCEHLVAEIQYFNSIQLITDEEKEFIRQDMYDLLNYMAEIAVNGCYPETQNKVNFYISQLIVDTNYSYVSTSQAKICFIHVFDKYEIYTYNSEMLENFKTLMQLKKRASVQISGVDEQRMHEFFSNQRRMVAAM